MNKAVNEQWAVQGERSNPLALWAITWIARHLGRGVARLLLYPIVAYFLIALRRVTQHSRRYLERVLARPVRTRDVARHFHCFASTILDRVFLLTSRLDEFDVQVYHEEIPLRHVQAGQGCLLIGSHLGSSEVLRCLARTSPQLRVRILMNRGQSPMMTRVLEALSPEMAAAVIDTGDRGAETILLIKEALEAGDFVALLGDREYGGERNVRCRFLGGEAVFPASPYLLASMLQVPVLLCFGLYRGGNRYDIHFEELAENLRINRQTRDADLQYWGQRYADRLEHYTRSAPYNWFNFYDFWKTPDETVSQH